MINMNLISEEFAEILGLLCAEGCHTLSYSSYWGKDRGKDRFFKNDKSERIEFYNKDPKLLDRYLYLLDSVFNYKPKITKHGKVNICKQHIMQLILGQTELGHLNWKVPNSVIISSNSVKICFIRGFFDGDGTVSNRVRMFSTNYKGLKKVSLILKQLDILHTFQTPKKIPQKKQLYIIQISERNKETFLNLIKPYSKCPDLRG
jgi:intein/homing endonuclease